MTFIPFSARAVDQQDAVLEYVAAGAGDGGTVRANEQAWAGWAVRPRMLRTRGPGDTGLNALGHRWASPIGVAPAGGYGFFSPDADLAVARAAHRTGAPLVLSHGAARPVEELAATGPFLQQLYLPRDRAAVVPFIERAVAAGALGLVLTVDNPAAVGHEAYRTRASALLRELSTDPVSRGLESGLAEDLSLRDVEWLASLTDRPVLVKGVLDERDALDVLAAGATGLVVSNHGGRQIERSVTAADVLPRIRNAVGADVPLLADGGIRRPVDAFVALALGADAVLLGRPVLHALRLGGETALTEQLKALRTGLAGLLAEAGRPNLTDIRPDAVVRTRPVLQNNPNPEEW